MAEEGGGEGMLVGGAVRGGEEGECIGDKDNYSKRVLLKFHQFLSDLLEFLLLPLLH